jgi:hypothetical protein
LMEVWQPLPAVGRPGSAQRARVCARPRSGRGVDTAGGGSSMSALTRSTSFRQCGAAGTMSVCSAKPTLRTSSTSGRCCDPQRSVRRQFGRPAIMLCARGLCMCSDQPKRATRGGCLRLRLPSARGLCDVRALPQVGAGLKVVGSQRRSRQTAYRNCQMLHTVIAGSATVPKTGHAKRRRNQALDAVHRLNSYFGRAQPLDRAYR